MSCTNPHMLKKENWEKKEREKKKERVSTEVEDDESICWRRAVINAAVRAAASDALDHLVGWHYSSRLSTTFCNIADTFIYTFFLYALWFSRRKR